MLVLALDTALQSCSAAVLSRNETLAARRLPLEKGHAEHLAVLVAETAAEAGVALKDLDRVGVVVGPGGFTGVRVGLAFARALALGTAIEVVGVTTMQALAETIFERQGREKAVAPVIDARRGQVYAALYGADGAEWLAPFAATPVEAGDRIGQATAARGMAGTTEDPAAILAGSGARLIAGAPGHWRLTDEPTQIDPVTLARLAAAARKPDGPPAPLYLRPPDARAARPSILAGLGQK